MVKLSILTARTSWILIDESYFLEHFLFLPFVWMAYHLSESVFWEQNLVQVMSLSFWWNIPHPTRQDSMRQTTITPHTCHCCGCTGVTAWIGNHCPAAFTLRKCVLAVHSKEMDKASICLALVTRQRSNKTWWCFIWSKHDVKRNSFVLVRVHGWTDRWTNIAEWQHELRLTD